MATRQQRRWIVGIALFALTAGCIAFSIGGSKNQPYYEGKSLEEWFDSLTYEGKSQEKIDLLTRPAVYSEEYPNLRAMGAIGSDAVPFLMHEFCASKSPWVERSRRLWSAIALAHRPYMSAGHRRFRAYLCLLYLGSKADSALPELIKIAEDASHPGSILAIVLLGANRSKPAIVIPVLQKMIAAPRAHGFYLAICALSTQGTNARPALPRLKEIEADPRMHISDRVHAASASMSINPADRQSLDFIVAQWDNTNDLREIREIIDHRQFVAATLYELGTNASPALPAIRKMMAQTESDPDPRARAYLSNSVHWLEKASGSESSQSR